MPTILRDAGLSGLVTGDLTRLADGFQFTEGPLWLPDGLLLFQDLRASKTLALAPDGSLRDLRVSTRGANGQTYATDGRIVVCEQDGRRVSIMNRDGSGVGTVCETYQGHRLNSPNDIIAASDGTIFFTDPPYGVPRPEDRELPYQAVFRLSTAGDLQPVIHEGFEKPNGLALSPDERTLYVNDTGKYNVRAFDLDPVGGIAPGSDRVLAIFDPGEPGGPDGIKVDVEGRLFVAVAEGIWVLEPDGRLLGILAVPKRPSNLAWGGADGCTLAITAGDSVYSARFHAPGVRPPFA